MRMICVYNHVPLCHRFEHSQINIKFVDYYYQDYDYLLNFNYMHFYVLLTKWSILLGYGCQKIEYSIFISKLFVFITLVEVLRIIIITNMDLKHLNNNL